MSSMPSTEQGRFGGMSNAKHTPGPWKSGAPYRGIVSATGKQVCYMTDVSEADHALMVAAPELLAALESAVSMLRGHQETPERVARYEFACAAIAKAKGE